MSDDGIWNGGKTNESKDKAIREWNKMIRKSGRLFRRSRCGNEYKRRINTNMDKPCEISGGSEINKFRKPEGSKYEFSGILIDCIVYSDMCAVVVGYWAFGTIGSQEKEIQDILEIELDEQDRDNIVMRCN